MKGILCGMEPAAQAFLFAAIDPVMAGCSVVFVCLVWVIWLLLPKGFVRDWYLSDVMQCDVGSDLSLAGEPEMLVSFDGFFTAKIWPRFIEVYDGGVMLFAVEAEAVDQELFEALLRVYWTGERSGERDARGKIRELLAAELQAGLIG